MARQRRSAKKDRDAESADALAPGGAIEDIGAGGANAVPGELPTLSQFLVRAGIASWSVVGILIVLAALVFALRQVEAVFPPLILGAAMVLMLEPFVAWLAARGFHRTLAATVVYLAALAIVVGAAYVAIPAMVRQGQQFADELPALLESGSSLASSALRRLNQGELGQRLTDAVTSYLGANAASIPGQVSRFASFGLRLANLAVTVVIGLIIGFYGLLALPRMGAAFTRLVPAERRAVIAPLGARIRDMFTGYLRARFIVSAAVGSIATVGLWLVGMPFWLILGITVGIANLIPMLGSVIGGVPVLIVALVTKPPVYSLVALGVLVVAHAVDGYLLSPRLVRGPTELHPILVLLAVLTGGALLGVWGILAAVPVAGAIQILVIELAERRRLAADAEAAVTT